MFSGAKERVLSPIKAINPPIDRAADVSLMVGDLKQKVYEQSKKALETLNPNTKVSLSKVYSSIKESIDGLRAAGTDESLAVADRLQAYMARQIEQHGDEVGSREAKKLIQGLDDITQYSPMAGSFDKAKNAAFKGVRSSLDQTLKEGSPEYRAAMESVSRDAGLLSEANTAFGSPEVAVGKLGRLNTPRGAFDRSTLGQLENAVGKQGAITKEADAFANAQRILKDQNALRKIEQSLPEYQALRSAMAEVAKRNPRWNAEQIEKATASKRRDLAEAVSRRVFAEHRLAPFKALTPGSTENKIKSLMRGSDINTKGVMDRLGKESGKDFVQMADDLAVKQSFDKGNTNGSRNTVMGTVVGFMFGGLYGAGIGATIGHQVIDRYGPKVGKLILDGMIKVKKSPRIQTIRSLKLPENIKQEMEREFRVFISKQNQSEVSSASRVADYGNEPSRSPSSLKGESKWIQDGMDKLGLQDQSIASSKKARELLIEASGLPANSKKLQIIKNKIQGLEK
jgi:outer membrane lipoprotein SlyB